MSDLRRHRPYLLWVIGLLGAAIVLVVAVAPPGSWALDQRRSATRTSPDGVAAWARSVDRLGVPVAERFQSFTSSPARGGGVVLLEPLVAPSALEVHGLLEWVRGGGMLVYSPSRLDLVMDSLDLGVSFFTPDEFGVPVVGRDSLLAHRWTEVGWAGPTNARFGLTADSTREETWEPLVLSTVEDIPTLAWVPEGEGGVLVVADAVDLSNGTLERSVVAIVAAAAIVDYLAEGDTLFFSEYHQALGGSGGPIRESLRLTRSTGVGRTVLHLAIVACVLLVLAGRRFGAPLPGDDEERRSTMEHVEALAGIYRAASSHRTAARHLVRGTARRLGGLQAAGSDPEIGVLERWMAETELAGPARAALEAFEQDPPDLPGLETALDMITSMTLSAKS